VVAAVLAVVVVAVPAVVAAAVPAVVAAASSDHRDWQDAASINRCARQAGEAVIRVVQRPV
jgi:hypothetical protein